MRWSANLIAILISSAALAVFSNASADDLPLPRLPDPAAAPLIVSGQNLLDYKVVIIPELYTAVRDNHTVFPAVARLKGETTFDLDFAKQSSQPRATFPPGFGEMKTRGFVFGYDENLKSETDVAIHAKKVLWNGQSAWWSAHSISASFEMFWLNGAASDRSAPERIISGTYRRAYPAALVADDKTGQLFRESLTVMNPDPLKGFEYLTYRFFGEEEDVFWVFSPANGRQRQLTGSNRGDELMKSTFALDDLMGWSGKIENIETSTLEPVTALVPLMEPQEAVADDSGCFQVPDKKDALGINFETHRFPQASPWLLTGIVYAPRQLWKIELISRDPYYLNARQVLYIDRSTMLPAYRVVYDRAGRLWKVVISVFGFAKSRDGSASFPYPGLLAIEDRVSNQGTVLRFSSVKSCAQPVGDLDLNQLAPRRPKAETVKP